MSTPREARREKVARLPPVDSHQRYEIPEASAYLRQSVAKTYVDIKGGKLRIIKDGARAFVPGTEIIRRSTLAPAA
jgi:ribosomal protein L17